MSVVVVVHDMARELPRTLRSLSPSSQQDITADDYDVIVVDNGSADPVDPGVLRTFPGRVALERIDPAPRSPARAANHGIALAEGDLIGLIVDGARLCSPGLLAGARRAARLSARPLITAPAFHLGDVPHMRADEVGYDQGVEDLLLASSGWEQDGYQLFGVSTLAGSSGRGLFGPMGESSSLFTTRSVWEELGGLDERFALPGGGLVNHDLYRRACALADVELIVLLGEGTFHQHHGGVATSRRLSWDEMHDDYVALRGEVHRPPDRQAIYVGPVAASVLPLLERSARQAIDRIANERSVRPT
jgi:glycosyltransferase involved in cell wall biosynthesis